VLPGAAPLSMSAAKYLNKLTDLQKAFRVADGHRWELGMYCGQTDRVLADPHIVAISPYNTAVPHNSARSRSE